MVKNIVRRDFLKTAAGAMAMGAVPPLVFADGLSRKGVNNQSELISLWDRQTKEVTPEIYTQYLQDGDTRGLKVLEALENGFEKVLREVKETVVRGNVPAIWSVYNMGYVVKTEKALFSIDLIHRRDNEFASLVDFALITHNHGDHWRQEFAKAVWARKKPVISNFLGYKGYTRAKKVFKIKDVEVRTSLIDHNDWLVDFTTAFEIRIGSGWTLYHTGDSGRGTVPKLETVWGSPDLWLLFPGCRLEVQDAVSKIKAKRIVFGHLWELNHKHNMGRFTEKKINARLSEAKGAGCSDVSVAFWGDRIV